MQVQELQAGDELLLDGGVRVTVLAVTEGTVLLKISADGVSREVALQVPARPHRPGVARFPKPFTSLRE